MKNGFNLVLAAGMAAAWLQFPALAQDKIVKPNGTAPPAAEDKSGLSDKDKMSYAIGMSIGNSIKRGLVELDVDIIAGAMKDVLAGKEPKLTDQQAQQAQAAYNQAARAKRDEDRVKTAEKNHKEGEAFLAENKKKDGVKVIPITLADGNTAELQYKVITEGTGTVPKSNDTVTVNYRGNLINGKEFDGSAKRGQPGKFTVNRVVRAWTEALQNMKVGSKWELYVPSTLGYADFGSGPMIEPGATLIFEIELLATESPAPPQPLTSDIIRVPSAEELKAGAKVEVIKPEDLERMTKAAAATNSANKKP